MGYLHLCSRSLIFDSDDQEQPLIKLRFNQQFTIEQLSGDQLQPLLVGNQALPSSNQITNYSNFFTGNKNNQGDFGAFEGKVGASNLSRWQTLPQQINSLNAQTHAPYNENGQSITALNVQEQQLQIKKNDNMTNIVPQQIKGAKISVKKNMKNHAKQSDASPSRTFRQTQSLKLDSPKKVEALKNFYSFLSSSLTQNSDQNQNFLLQEQLAEFQLVIITVRNIIKIPRSPPGPQYLERDPYSKFSQPEPQHFIFIMSLEESRFLVNLIQFTQPVDNVYRSEDEILTKYLDSEKQRFLEYVRHTELQQHCKYPVKQIVKRITIEGEHTYLMLIKQEEKMEIQLRPIINAPHQVQPINIKLDQIKFALAYRYLYQHKGIRIVVHQSNDEFILVFSDLKKQKEALEFIKKNSKFLENSQVENNQIYYQQLWQQGVLTTGDYLLYLNFIGNRSFNDLTQYPVFPWLISDYKNDSIKLQNYAQTYRDLSMPIGALSSDKLEQFKSKYFEIINKSTTLMHHEHGNNAGQEKPYMYLSHYSTPGIVLYYLIRQVPSYILKVQNEGYGGPPDRIFYDVSRSWFNGLSVLADNKELIPEFYFGDGSFMKNLQSLELGLNHLEEQVGDVVYPMWASSHLDLVMKNRQILESNHVSGQIHKWIDLIFGHLQKGEKASLANNLFQPSSLEENINFDDITSDLELQAVEAQIRNFGQCPFQLFTEAHPERYFRTILLKHPFQISPQTQSNSGQDQSGLEQQCELQLNEIENLRRAFDEINERNEENLLKQMQEFKHLDEVRRKRITRYKEDGDKQISKYKQMVDFLKQQKQAIKDELDAQITKEQSYLNEIEDLKQQIKHQNQAQVFGPGLSHLIEKKPGTAEYLKSLDIGKEFKAKEKKKNQIPSGGIILAGMNSSGLQSQGHTGTNSRIGIHANIGKDKYAIKLKTINNQ